MPLDPTLARGFDLPKIESPIDQMGGALTNALMMSKMNTSRDESLRNAMLDKVMRARMRPDGTYDQGGVLYDMAQAGLGRGVTGQQKSFADLAETQSKTAENNAQALGAKATAKKAAAETREKLVGMIPMLLKGANTIDDVRTSLSRYAQDPSFIDSMGGLDATKVFFEGIASEAKGAEKMGTFPQWLYSYQTDPKTATEKKVDSRDLGGTMVTSSYNVSGPNAGKLRTETTEKITESPKAPRTTIHNNMPGQPATNAFEETVGKGAGNEILAYKDAADTAPKIVSDVNKIRGQLKKAFTGKAAGVVTDIVAWGKAAGLNVPNDRLVASQVVRKYFKDNIFNLIAKHKMAGASVTPFSNVDMKITEDASANQELDPAAINKLLDDLEDAAYESAEGFNRRRGVLDSGKMTNPAVKAMMMQDVQMPPRQYRDDDGDVIGEQYIQRLRANPNAAAAFDKEVGVPGLAAKILRNQGGTSTQAAPFSR